MKFLSLGGAVLLLTLTGCAGYRLGGAAAQPAYLKNIHNIAVPAFRNNTLVPRLEGLITDTVIKQIQQDGTYHIVKDSDADAILTGYIEKVERQPARSVRGNVLLASEFNLTVSVRFQLIDRTTNKILDSGRLEGQTSFFVGNDVQQDEQQAIPIAAEQLAVRIVSQLTEGF